MRIISALSITAMIAVSVGCNRPTPLDKAIAEAVVAEEVAQFGSPDLAFFELRDHVKRYQLFTTYDITMGKDGSFKIAPNPVIIPDERPVSSEYTALFDIRGNAIGDNLESIACGMNTTWKDTASPGEHTRGQYIIVRDNNGYISAEICPIKELQYTWIDGQLKKTVWIDSENSQVMSIKEYTYDNRGLLTKVKETYPADGVTETTIYTDYLIDNRGNWTMRIGCNDLREMIFAEIRRIEYF